MTPKECIKHGDEFPFDAPDSWWNSDPEEKQPPPKPLDWAHRAARGIIADLEDRKGIKRGFEGIDEEIRFEIVKQIACIIGAAFSEADIL